MIVDFALPVTAMELLSYSSEYKLNASLKG